MFNPKIYKNHLSTSWLGHNLHYYEELESSNTHAKKLKSDSSLHGTVILADHQTGGKGQHQRKWITEPGANLTFSVIFEPKKNDRLTLLTLACGLAVSECINAESSFKTQLKWPNDVLYNGKKLCGILTETQFSGNKLEKIIVGIGLNVNQFKFTEGVQGKATSLAIIHSKTHNREKLLATLLRKIEYYYRLWNQHNPDLVKQVNPVLVGYGEWVKLTLDEKELDGKFKFLGVNETGVFIALNEELEIRTFAYEQVRVWIDE